MAKAFRSGQGITRLCTKSLLRLARQISESSTTAEQIGHLLSDYADVDQSSLSSHVKRQLLEVDC